MKRIIGFLFAAICSCCAFNHIDSVVDNRPLYIEEMLSTASLGGGSPLAETVKNKIKTISAPGDVVGMLVDEKVGGSGNESYNAMPMNPATHDFWQTKVVSPIVDYLRANKSSRLSFSCIPLYGGGSRRPLGFGIFVRKLDNSNAFLIKGYVVNPTKSESETAASYTYHTGNVWNVERKNESFDIVGKGGDQARLERVEMVTKKIRPSDLTTGTDLDDNSKNYTNILAEGKPHVPGLLISKNLGGKGDDPYNVVPMSPKAVEQFKTRIEEPLLSYFANSTHKDKKAVVIVMVLYGDSSSGRPVGFIALSRTFDVEGDPTNIYIPNV